METEENSELAIQSISVPIGKDAEHAKTISTNGHPEFSVKEIVSLLASHGIAVEQSHIGTSGGSDPAIGLYNRGLQEFITSDNHYGGPYCELTILIGRLKVQ